jgi:hypothetical protein
MAYDPELAGRVREVLDGEPGVAERRMFGGLAFLVGGNLAVAASGQGGLLVRVDPAASDTLIDGDAVTPMEMRGRELAGWLHVRSDADTPDDDLHTWVQRGLDYARTLPAKAPG